ncbi:hypothetical protein QJQ45_029108 [Haematococcus lacustris]|nr:hypothetical protein QJQ45_029108 [Haematococcus lacustris]
MVPIVEAHQIQPHARVWTVDVGIPQLAMHSIREMCGTDDVGIAYRHFLAFWQDFSRLDATLDVDSLPPAHLLGTIDDTACHHVHAPKAPLINMG